MNGSSRDCYTCQHSEGDALGALLGDPHGHITCQTERDARRAVSEWCAFVGTGKSCDSAAVTCARADTARLYETTNGTTFGEDLEFQTHVEVFGYVKAAGDIPGVKAEGRIGVKVGGDLSFKINVLSQNLYPWVERNGVDEADGGTRYSCEIRSSTFKALSADGKVELGLTFQGNGVSGGVEVKADGRRIETAIGTLEDMTAAGLTKEQISGRCKAWAIRYLSVQLANTGVARQIEQFTDLANEQTFSLQPASLYCSFPGDAPGWGSKLSEVRVQLGQEGARVSYLYQLDYWWDLRSSEHMISPGSIAPFKQELQNGQLDGGRLVDFMNQALLPHTNNDGAWRLLLCYWH